MTMPLAFLGNFGAMEILLLLLIVVLLFGARKLPELGKGLGDGIRSFKSAMKGDGSETESSDKGGTKPSN